MAQLLLQQNCTVVMAHSHTRDIEDECRQADILVAAIGRPPHDPWWLDQTWCRGD